MKSLDNLLMYLMLDPAFIEVKIEKLKIHEFRHCLGIAIGKNSLHCHVIGENIEVTP